jgi:hypothetical protein
MTRGNRIGLVGFNGGAGTDETAEGNRVMAAADEADKLFKKALLAELNNDPEAEKLKAAAAAAREYVVQLMKN